jgi:hypothetical protein
MGKIAIEVGTVGIPIGVRIGGSAQPSSAAGSGTMGKIFGVIRRTVVAGARGDKYLAVMAQDVPVHVCGARTGRAGRLRPPVTAIRRRAQVPG